MLIKKGFSATDGIALRTIEDQSQIVSSMERLALVNGQSHSMGNQRTISQGLVQLELIEDYQASNGVCVSTNYLGLLGMYTQDQIGEFLLQQCEESNK